MKELAAFIENQDKLLTMQGLRALTNQEVEILSFSMENISELQKLYDTDYLLKKNYFAFLEYMDFIENNKDALVTGLNIRNSMQEIIQETNRLLLNLLFSFTATVEHFKHNLKKNDQDEYERMLKNLFDSCGDYAFIWKLRNFAQHQCLPISNIQTDNSIDSGTKISILLNKSDLLQYDSWGTIAKPFLENQEPTFEITSILINAVTELHNTIFLFWLNKYISDSEKDFEIILNFIQEIMNTCKKQNKKLAYPIILNEISSKNSDKNNLSMTFSHFPIDFLNKIGVIDIEKNKL